MKNPERREQFKQRAHHREVDFGTGGGSTHSRVDIDSSLPRPLSPGRTQSTSPSAGPICAVSQSISTSKAHKTRPPGDRRDLSRGQKKASYCVKAKKASRLSSDPPNAAAKPAALYNTLLQLHCSYVHTDRPTGIQVCRRSQAHRQTDRSQILT